MKKILFIYIFLLLSTNLVFGKTNLKLSLPVLPPLVIDKNQGAFIDLVKAMNDEYKDGKIEIIGVFPFARSVGNVVSGKADFHMPMLKNIKRNEKLDYIESKEILFNNPWVLYANKNVKGLNANTVRNFRICTDRGNVDNFDFNIQPVNDIEAGLKMVEAGRMDGFIFAMGATDEQLKKLGIKNIRRTFYRMKSAVMILPKNERGIECEKILSKIISSLKTKGIYQKILRPYIIGKYVEWQP